MEIVTKEELKTFLTEEVEKIDFMKDRIDKMYDTHVVEDLTNLEFIMRFDMINGMINDMLNLLQ